MAVARLWSEDEPMLRGSSRYTADLPLWPDTLHAVFVRSSVAHGDLLSIECAAAREAPGVVAVWTATELGLPAHSYYPATTLDGVMARPLLAAERVRFVGEPVAVVVAETLPLAIDAAELVEVDIEARPAIIDPYTSAHNPADLLFPAAGTNVVLPLDGHGVGGSTSDPLIGAAFVGEVVSDSPRLTSAPIEPCAIVAAPSDDAEGPGLDVVCTGQGVHRQHETFASVLGLAPRAVRVRHPDVGGAFGGRGDALAEFLVVGALAQRLGRPVRWVQSRQEQFFSMPYGRGQRHHFRVGLDAEGRIVGVDASMWCDAGAYPHMAPVLAGASRRQCTGMYRVPQFRYRYGAAVTNLPPVGAYRGAGQPEVNLALERAIDQAARVAGLDPVEVRRRNLLRPAELPWPTGTGIEIDSGDAVEAMETALSAIDGEGWRQEGLLRRERGDRRAIGVGVGCYAQTAGSGDGADYAHLELASDGSVLVSCASAGHGQGHWSLWAAMVSGALGIAPERVTVVDADTEVAPHGQTTGGSRTSFVLGSQITAAAGQLFEAARLVAADLLEAHPDDLVVSDDGWSVAGVPARLVSWADVAGHDEPLSTQVETRIGGPTHPYGTHAAVVEVDLDTGGVELLAYVAVDDCGTVLDTASVEGQQHGGAVAGIAAALWEAALWEPDGTPRTATLGDYLLPSAAELPMIATIRPGIPTKRNPLGARGIGENGAIAGPAAVQNAVIDALAHLGVDHIDIPVTPERVWSAIHRAGQVAVREGGL